MYWKSQVIKNTGNKIIEKTPHMLSYKKVLKEPSNGNSIKSLKRKVMENKGNKIKIIKKTAVIMYCIVRCWK